MYGALIICLGCGKACPSSSSGRCGPCRNEQRAGYDQSPERRMLKLKYDAEHRELRAFWRPIVATGTVACRHCKELIAGDEVWDLGHTPGEESKPWHAFCNRSHGGAMRAIERFEMTTQRALA